MILITKDNSNLLFQARFNIDGPFTQPEGLWQEVAKYARGTDHRAYVIREKGTVLGYVELKLDENELPNGAPLLPELMGLGHIARIGVRKDSRGHGLGKRLLHTAEKWLQTKGKAGDWLDYYSDNVPACTLYSNAGYRNIVGFDDGGRVRRIAVKKWS